MLDLRNVRDLNRYRKQAFTALDAIAHTQQASKAVTMYAIAQNNPGQLPTIELYVIGSI